MSEKIELQSNVDDTSHTEQDDSLQGTSPSTKAAAVTMSRWRKTSFTVVTLLAYMFMNAGISMITPFFAIVVSFSTITLGVGQAHVHRISISCQNWSNDNLFAIIGCLRIDVS